MALRSLSRNYRILDLFKAEDAPKPPHVGISPTVESGNPHVPATTGPKPTDKFVTRSWHPDAAGVSKWHHSYSSDPGMESKHSIFPGSPKNNWEHTLKLTPGSYQSKTPEEAFNTSFNENTPHNAVIPFKHPRTGEPLNAKVNHVYAKKFSVFNASGQPLTTSHEQSSGVRRGSKKLSQPGQTSTPLTNLSTEGLHRWYMGQRDYQPKYHPTTKQHTVTVLPNYGTADPATGLLTPPSDSSYDKYSIYFSKEFPEEHKAKIKRAHMTATNEDVANKRVENIHKELDKLQNPEVLPSLASTSPKPIPNAGQEGSIAHKVENPATTGVKFHRNPTTGKPSIGADPKERDALIRQALKEHANDIMRQSKRVAGSKTVNVDPGELYTQNMDPNVLASATEFTRRQGTDWINPESPEYRGMGEILDSYDPSKGIPLAGYVRSRHSPLNWAFYKEGMKGKGEDPSGKGKIMTRTNPLERKNAEGKEFNVGDVQQSRNAARQADLAHERLAENVDRQRGYGPDIIETKGQEEPGPQDLPAWRESQRTRLSNAIKEHSQYGRASGITPEQRGILSTFIEATKSSKFTPELRSKLTQWLHDAGLGHLSIDSAATIRRTPEPLLVAPQAPKPAPVVEQIRRPGKIPPTNKSLAAVLELMKRDLAKCQPS